MAEYINVEKPFLEKLKQLGWQVIDQGIGLPGNPEKSFRKSFREVVLEDEFKKAVKAINKTADGQEWLTDDQLDAVFDEITSHHGKKLFEANKDIFQLLTKNTRVRENTVTGEQDPIVRLIDFDNWDNNSFIAINQFRIKTPGGPREGIIPDIVLFVNGLPFIVVECKDIDVTEPLSEAEIQIRRYSNRRDDVFGIKEGEERLFHYNLFSIITHGEEARFGTISADFEYYYNWKNSCLNYLLHLGLIKKTGFHFFTYSNSYMAYYEGNGYGFHDGVMVKSINSESLGTIDGLISEHSNIELDANFFDIVKDYLNDSDPKMKIDNCNGYYSWIHTSGETK